ncbi:hypothetical protein, partial [Minwuia sp.]|uniref:hypothetical protein n=1 Tax=Minwuia sp. TaxID=2493630 RepID=UPI003A927260
ITQLAQVVAILENSLNGSIQTVFALVPNGEAAVSHSGGPTTPDCQTALGPASEGCLFCRGSPAENAGLTSLSFQTVK